MTNARIIGTGGYLPERILTNQELEGMVETSDEWIRERSGIRQRHIVADDEKTSDMAYAAALNAIEMAAIDRKDIDLIILATTTADKVFPSTACILQRRLGLDTTPAFDIGAACSGFLYALDMANRYIRTGGAKTVLVIGAESMSRVIDWTDRATCVLFGDGAGAILLQATEEEGVISTRIYADGQHEELLHVPANASGRARVRAEASYVQMKGSEVFRKAVSALGAVARETLEENNVAHKDLTWLIPHQANLRIITATAKKLRLPMSQVIVTVDEHANTSSASIPLALDKAVRDGRVQRGDLLLLEAFGAGFTWGAALVRF